MNTTKCKSTAHYQNVTKCLVIRRTWNVSSGCPTILPSQLKAWFTNPRMAIKAIRFAAMLATRPIEADAPLLAASRMFCSSLGSLKKKSNLAHKSRNILKGEKGEGQIYLPTRHFNILVWLEATLFCFWVRKFRDGQCTRSSHHRGRYQGRCINLQNTVFKEMMPYFLHIMHMHHCGICFHCYTETSESESIPWQQFKSWCILQRV